MNTPTNNKPKKEKLTKDQFLSDLLAIKDSHEAGTLDDDEAKFCYRYMQENVIIVSG